MPCLDKCTEQPIPRPAKNRKKRRLYYYSGKKKKYTMIKNLYTANQKGLSIYKSKHKQTGGRDEA
jgi:hypothetical protein